MPAAFESHRWIDLCTTDFAHLDRDRAVAVLPVAAVEQHGPHLPLGVDTLLLEGIVDRAIAHLAPEQPVFFLPTQAIGFSPEHTAFAGTLSLRAETVIRLWTEIGEGVAAAGVRRLLIFNGHGGQVGLLDPVARDLRARLGLRVYSSSWFQLPWVDAQGEDLTPLFSAHEHRFGVHAGEVETSLMLALDPQAVRHDALRDFPSRTEARARRFPILGNGRSVKFAWTIQDLNPEGATGAAATADAVRGQRLLDAIGLQLARLLGEMAQDD